MPTKGKGKMVYLHNELYNRLAEVRGTKTWDKFIAELFNQHQSLKIAELEQAKAQSSVMGNSIEISEETKEGTMADCPNCTAREIEMQRVKNEVIPALKSESEKTVKALSDQVAELTRQLKEKPAPVPVDEIPEDLEKVIAHCESGKCPAHAQQWEVLKKRIVDANAPTIVQHTLENLPDTVVESEGLKRGFIPKRITIPVKSR